MPESQRISPRTVAIVGGGPAGLMAAEVLACAGASVDLYDAMPSVGRKFLLAGKGGLNLTHSEPAEAFAGRYAERRASIESMLCRFGPAELRAWAQGLGIATFVGSSGRVFPTDLKAAPLLRAWLHRLRGLGVRFHMRHRWVGWADSEPAVALAFATADGVQTVRADAVLLALGGASWSRLGSDGAWVPWLTARGVELAPLRPSNCGFDAAHVDVAGSEQPGWSEHFRTRHAGVPVKNVALSCAAPDGHAFAQAGEFVVTEGGVEGSLIYAASAWLRDSIEADGRAVAHLDLLPGRSADWVAREVAHPRGSRSLSTHLKGRLGLDGVKAALLRELLPREVMTDPARLAAGIKSLPLTLTAARPIDEAISTAGGVRFEAMDDQGMLRALPGVFCAGEMLDWEAPTGGYLLTASLSSGAWAGHGLLQYLTAQR
ncbi:MAG: TIGR03862 family flavoprotein [Burkholderiaceae bacterium]|nr:TIGR03862 family flavoprotein [Burkholderiaceae bacterium]